MLASMNHASQHRAPPACSQHVGIYILFCKKDMSHACQHESCLQHTKSCTSVLCAKSHHCGISSFSPKFPVVGGFDDRYHLFFVCGSSYVEQIIPFFGEGIFCWNCWRGAEISFFPKPLLKSLSKPDE